MTSIDAVNDAIFRGDYDDHFDSIQQAIKARQGMLEYHKFWTIKAGDRVRLVNLRPKYMVGATGVVLNKKQSRVTVKLDAEWMARNPRSRFSSEVDVTPNMIENIG